MLGLTGLAVKFSDLLVSVGRQNMIATLILAMIVLIILGMGIPPTAVYVLGSSIIVPALIGLGLNKMHKRRTLIDSPQVRGMVAKISHLVRIVEDEKKA